ncbi:MAG TPA: hypothetical protein VIH48_02795 [Candidatus Bathyarchaeia archaeon]
MTEQLIARPSIEEEKIVVLDANCLIWQVCPISDLKGKLCNQKGSPACKEYIRLVKNENGRYKGDLR